MTSQVDQKRAINKMKHDLEPWRNIIVFLESLLTWEKNFYPAIIGASVTFFYLVLWLLNLSTVTMLSLAGLFVVMFDYVYPSLSKFVFNTEDWCGEQEARFDQVCTRLCGIKMILNSWFEYLFDGKERKSTMFVIIMSAALIVFAWIGALIDNLLLMYMVTLCVVMYPGIKEKSIFNKVKDRVHGVVNSKLQQFKDNSKKTE